MRRRPPSVWLAAAAVSSAWMALFTVVTWIRQFIVSQAHDDVRLYYVAAKVGLLYGWSRIYDHSALQSVSNAFPAATRIVDEKSYASTPLLAWTFAPLTVFPEPVAYVIWVLVSLAALGGAWWLVAPYGGLARITVLLVAIGLGPVLLTLYFGQPTLIVVALIAASWWFASKDHHVAAGTALALATFFKPQAVLLLPVALLLAGRYRVLAAWAGGCAFLGAAALLSLGSSGLSDWWNVVRVVQRLPLDIQFTLAGPLGSRPLTYAIWLVEGAAAMSVAWARRTQLEAVFAAGMIGTVATATYFHNSDYSVLILAAWLILRTRPPLWQRAWIATGIVPMQLLLTPLSAGPQLIWDAAWLALLAVQSLPALHAKAVPAEIVVAARAADQPAGRVGL